DFAIVGMVALREPVARRALAAGKRGARRLAQHRGREGAREFRLADSAPAVHEERMWKALAIAGNAAQRLDVPWKGAHAKARAKASPSRARTCSSVPLAST